MISDKVIKFVQKPSIEKLLSASMFDEIYTIFASNYSPRDNADLTQLLTAAGIDFLPYMSRIPAYCYKNSSIENVDIPDSVKGIERCAFWKSRLTSIKIPRSVRRIGDLAFLDTPLEEGITLSDGLISIGVRAFYESGIPSIVFPDTVEYIGDAACELCPLLEDAELPLYLKEIPNSMFKDCTALRSITIKLNCKHINRFAFFNCINLRDVVFKGNSQQWNDISGFENSTALFKCTVHCSDGDLRFDENLWEFIKY